MIPLKLVIYIEKSQIKIPVSGSRQAQGGLEVILILDTCIKTQTRICFPSNMDFHNETQGETEQINIEVIVASSKLQ